MNSIDELPASSLFTWYVSKDENAVAQSIEILHRTLEVKNGSILLLRIPRPILDAAKSFKDSTITLPLAVTTGKILAA